MKEQLISFETAKLAKEKGFDIETLHFYTKPNSKMFGLDEHGRSYSIINTPKKVYTCGKEVTLNIKSVYPAPTQSLLAAWLRKIHKIDIIIKPWTGDTKGCKMYAADICIFGTNMYFKLQRLNTYEEALEEGLLKALNIIKV